MEDKLQAFIITMAAASVILCTILVIYMFYNKKRAKDINKSDTINKKGRNKLYLFYRIFKVVPGFNRIFQKILLETEMIYPSDSLSVNREATKITLKALTVSVGIAVLTCVVSQGNFLYSCMGILTGAVLFTYQITSKFNKMEYKLLEQLRNSLATIKSHYLNRQIVEDAIEDTLDEVPYEIGLHLSKIYEILTSPFMEEKLEEYTASAPNRYFLLFVSICSSIKEYGGDSFIDSMKYLKEEINVEILKRDNIKSSFTGLTVISLVAVVFLKPIEIWSRYTMPELSDFYDGSSAQLLMVLSFVVSFVCYYLVEILQGSKRGALVRTNIFMRISQLPGISPFFNRIINQNYTKARLLNEKLKDVGDQTGPKAFMIKQCVFALVTFLFLNSSFLISTVTQKLTMLNNYVAEFDSDVVPNSRYLEAMQTAAYDVVQSSKDWKEISKEDISDQVLATGTIQNREYADIVADEVLRELNAYKNTYYKWYHLLITVGAALLAYNMPKWILEFKRKVASMSKEDEVAQFQTIVLVLMHVDGIRLDIILDWMDRFAYCFKATVEDCILSLEDGEKNALETMRESEDNSDFRQFTDCLLSIDEMNIDKAFSEIIVDRNYSIQNRQQKNASDVRRKSGLASYIALVPLITILVSYLVVPMFMLMADMLSVSNISF